MPPARPPITPRIPTRMQTGTVTMGTLKKPTLKSALRDATNFLSGHGDNSIKHTDWPHYTPPPIDTIVIPDAPKRRRGRV